MITYDELIETDRVLYMKNITNPKFAIPMWIKLYNMDMDTQGRLDNTF